MWNSVLSFHGCEKEARTRAANRGLGIILEDEFRPRTDSKNMFLQRPLAGWSEDQWIVWWYSYEHELGHNEQEMVRSFDLLREKKIAPKSFIGSMLNLTEDHRQEHHRVGEYVGRDKRLDAGRHRFLNDMVHFDSYGQDSEKHRLAGETWFIWDTIERSSWQHSVIGMGERGSDYLTVQQLEWLDKLLLGDYGKTLKSNPDEYELYELVKRIISEVFEFDADQEEKDAQEQQKQDDAKQEGSGDGEGEGEDGEGEGDPESGEGEGGDGEGSADGDEQARKKAATVDYSDLLAHQHDSDSGSGATYTSMTINYNDYAATNYPNTPLSSFKIVDYASGAADTSRKNGYYSSRMRVQTDTSLAKKVKRLLQVRAQARYQHGRKRGKISPKSIYRVGIRDNKRAAERIFKKKDDNDILDVAVSILVDCSGSMGGSKYKHAYQSTALLNLAIATLNVPLEIVGFTDNSDAPVHAIFKSFTKSVSSSILKDRFSDFSDRGMDGNSDGESILWTYNRLLRVKSKRKILLVLSDGQPAGYRGDCYGHTAKVIQEIEKANLVEIGGIGIMSNAVAGLYKYHDVIQSSDVLEKAVLNVISKKIIN